MFRLEEGERERGREREEANPQKPSRKGSNKSGRLIAEKSSEKNNFKTRRNPLSSTSQFFIQKVSSCNFTSAVAIQASFND